MIAVMLDPGNGQPAQALEEIRADLENNPTNLPLRVAAIDICLHLPKPDLAAVEALIQKAPQLDPADRHLPTWVHLLRLLSSSQGKTQQAISFIRGALDAAAQSENHTKLLPWMLVALLHDHQDRQCVIDWNQNLHRQPDQFAPEPWTQLALARAPWPSKGPASLMPQCATSPARARKSPLAPRP